MNIDAETVINKLAIRIAELEVQLAVAQSQMPTELTGHPDAETGTEIVGDGVRLMEIIDGEGEDN